MPDGFIKLSRSLLEWEWHDEPKTAYLYIVLLLLANYEETLWRGETLRRGQLLTGRRQLSIASGLSEREVRTALSHLRKTGYAEVKSKSKYSIITLMRYDDHCCITCNSDAERPSDSPENAQQNDHQSDQQNLQSTSRKTDIIQTTNGQKTPCEIPDNSPANPQQVTSRRPASDHIQELKELKELKKGLLRAPAPACGEDGDELLSQIGNVQRASALIRRYGLTDNDATLEALLEDAERVGFDALEEALNRASVSDKRGGISVNYYRAILRDGGRRTEEIDPYAGVQVYGGRQTEETG